VEISESKGPENGVSPTVTENLFSVLCRGKFLVSLHTPTVYALYCGSTISIRNEDVVAGMQMAINY
jgi:hypothetical protein